MNTSALTTSVARTWDSSIVPQLVEYIRIPAKSPHFDPRWEANGHIERVIGLAEAWVRQQPVRGLVLRNRAPAGAHAAAVLRCAGHAAEHTVLLYGHLDKQPEMTGWREGLGPWQPVLEDGKLYGRGGADDGYAVFASLAAIGALQAQGMAHARCVGLIETCEESGSYDLPAYLELLAPRMGARGLRRRPRFRLRRLRAAVGDDIAARPRGRDAQRRGADGRRAFGRRERHRSVVVSHCARHPRPPRGQRDRPRAARGVPRADSRGTRARRRRPQRRSWARRRYASIPLPAGRSR